MPTYGQRPIDVVTDSRGNTLRGILVKLYASSQDAHADDSVLGTALTDARGRWTFDSPASEVWVRTPDGTVWQVSSTTGGATAEQLAGETAAREAADADLDARVDALEAGGVGGGSTDHGALTGLADDDHPQYHTDARGDVRYYPRWDVDAELAAKADAGHTHPAADVSDSTATGRALLTAADAAAARAAIGAGTSSLALGTTSSTAKAGDYQPTWSQVTGKPTTFTPASHTHVVGDTTGLQTALDGKAAASHGHAISDVTSLQASLDGKAASSHTHGVADLTATGTRDSTKFLRGDNVWAVPAGGGGGSGSDLGVKWVSVADHGALGDGSTNDTAAIIAARDAAGVGGQVYFPYTGNAYMTDPVKPLSYQTWYGQHSPRYAWDNTQNGGSVLRARGTQTAVIYNDNNTTNGVATQASRGVTIRNLCIQGGASGTARTARGIDFGQMAGPERGWMVRDCSFNFCTTAIAGYLWASQFIGNHFSRNGYGIAPDQGLGGGRMNDCMVTHNYLYFNVNHAISLAGASESGLSTIAFNRLERSGAAVTGSATYDPTGTPENTFACGLYITRATAITIVGNSSDANTGPGLCIRAAAHGTVNNVQSNGNVWKRDGIGSNNGSATLAGVEVKDSQYVQIRDSITYGDPNDGGAGVSAPYYGLQYEANDWLTFDGSAQLDTNGNTTSRGIRSVGTANWMCSITDARQPVMGVPAAATSSAPTAGLQMGSMYYDTTLDALRVWDGAAWDSMGGGGGGVTDHGALTGLADDDHPQYALADGSRGNVWVINSPTGWGSYAGPPPAGTLIVRY